MVCTRKGRVVYNRRPTPFTWRDIRRILRAMENEDVAFEWEDAAMFINDVFINLAVAAATKWNVPGRIIETATDAYTSLMLAIDRRLEALGYSREPRGVSHWLFDRSEDDRPWWQKLLKPLQP